ncbi:DUF2254 family protein [Massilia glaciei]|uniref:DUF2254 domain-containing protein n=1 Tax=Massilia glaciei TaxID=1524097 RepID=A0A2U2HLU2_9BURK|nr:DUF2254 family protein [Massilia glaciei]PWF48484.1 DUF2254 domain-containing protein [Massilia glaciei]
MNKVVRVWQNIGNSLWFIPAVIMVLAVVLALFAIEADSRISAEFPRRWPRVFGTSTDGARGVLQVIASAILTVAGLTFSITVLVLSLAASQYAPRVIRTFMSKRPTQMVGAPKGQVR